MRGPAGEGGAAVGQDANELEALGNDPAVAGLDLMREQEQERGLVAVVGGIHQDAALPEEVGVLLQQDIAEREHERVTWMDHAGKGEAGPFQRADGFSGEADALVAFEDRREVAAVAPDDDTVALAQDGRDMRDFKTIQLTRIDRTAQGLNALHEERADEIGLEAPGLGLFHFLLHGEETFRAEALLFLRLAPVVAVDAAMYDDDGVVAAQHAGNLLVQVIEGVAVLAEDDDLAHAPTAVVELGLVPKNAGQLVPLPVLAGGDQVLGPLFEALQRMMISAASSLMVWEAVA